MSLTKRKDLIPETRSAKKLCAVISRTCIRDAGPYITSSGPQLTKAEWRVVVKALDGLLKEPK